LFGIPAGDENEIMARKEFFAVFNEEGADAPADQISLVGFAGFTRGDDGIAKSFAFGVMETAENEVSRALWTPILF